MVSATLRCLIGNNNGCGTDDFSRCQCYDPRVPTGTSAAQNGPVIRICPKCGALSLNGAQNCNFCEDPVEEAIALTPAATGAIVGDRGPEWQEEVIRRLEQYRVRRQHRGPDTVQ